MKRALPSLAVQAPPLLVCRWDLDKTYLLTEFGSLRELVRIPFEKAEQKVAAPGVAALIRGLREAANRQGRQVRIYFVSASPPQIGREIRKKLELDGITYDGIVFKDQLQRLMRGKFRHLREQVGYKLTELLKARTGLDLDAPEYLFGDDWESDPLIYSLYADVLAGRVEPPQLRDILTRLRVDPPLVEKALALAGQVARGEAVRRIFINLERRTPPRLLRVYGGRLVPTFNYLQTAACLFAEGALDAAAIVAVARSLREEAGYTPSHLTNSLRDLERRGHVRRFDTLSILRCLRENGLVAAPRRGRFGRVREWWRLRAAYSSGRRATPPAPAAIDYGALITHEHDAEGQQAGGDT